MTFNKNGGNRAKKQGRKHTVSGGEYQIVNKTRFAKDKDEIYAAVIKEFGNGRALVKCIDGVERLLHIRKKFKGRSKGQNYIKSGVWVLAGLRSWESLKKEGIKENCDLLEVYQQQDVKWLKKNEDKPWFIIETVGRVETYGGDADEGDGAEFSGDEFGTGLSEEDEYVNEYIGGSSKKSNSKKTTSTQGQYIELDISDDNDDDDDELNIDDL
jgi:translation initiation factor 1A